MSHPSHDHDTGARNAPGPSRQTRQQRAILDAFESRRRPLSVDEVHEMARESVPSLGQRTVYRVIRKFEDEGVLSAVQIPGEADRYELAEIAATHHHHFHCKTCDRVYDVEGCVGNLNSMVPDGFVISDHELTLRGVCASCA